MKSAPLFATAATVAIAAAQPAAAELTAQQVWENWQAMTAELSGGASISADSETYADGVLTLDGLSYGMSFEQGEVSARLNRMVMTELDDGTVDVSYQGDYLVDVDFTSPEGESVTLEAAVKTPGLKMNVAEADGGQQYVYSADAIVAELAALAVDGKPLPGVAEVALNGLTGSYTLMEGEPPSFDSSYAANELTATIDFADPENPQNSFKLSAAYNGVTISSAGNLVGMTAMRDPAAMLSGEIVASGTFAHSGGSSAIDATSEAEGPFKLSTRSDSGEMHYDLNADGLAYETRNTGVAISLAGAAIPMPEVSATLDELAFRIAMPLQPTDQAKDLSVLVNLGGLAVPEMLWAMVDPTGALPHDPATLMVALDGKARLTAALTDEAAMAAPIPPVDFEALDLTGLRLAVAGAELTGSGGFDFSAAPEGAMPGMPGVAGEVTLTLSGGNALLDNLVAMGLIPQDQAMGFQMMMGMLAKPVGDDKLESLIELGADGSISANGNPLK